jgi:uncharacterized protein (TIGR02145 family)
VPTAAEFTTLVTTLGTNPGTQAKSTTLWASAGNGTNSSGFNGLPSGFRNTNGGWDNLSFYGFFWATSSGFSRVLDFGNAFFTQFTFSSLYGFSVRCLKN